MALLNLGLNALACVCFLHLVSISREHEAVSATQVDPTKPTPVQGGARMHRCVHMCAHDAADENHARCPTRRCSSAIRCIAQIALVLCGAVLMALVPATDDVAKSEQAEVLRGSKNL